MDMRTEQEKIADMANRVERVIVVAPSHQMIADWCWVRHVSPARVIPVHNGADAQHRLQGTKGLPHVILGWSHFTDNDRDMIRAYLEITRSVPYVDEEAASVVPAAADLRR